MSQRPKRRTFTAEQKAEVVRRHLGGNQIERLDVPLVPVPLCSRAWDPVRGDQGSRRSKTMEPSQRGMSICAFPRSPRDNRSRGVVTT